MKQTIDPVEKSLLSWSLEGGWGLLAGLTAGSLLLAGVRLLPLEFQKLIVNQAIQNKDISLLYQYCLGFILSVLAGMGLKYGILFMQALLGERALAKMRIAFFSRALTLPWTFFHCHGPGAITTPLINYLGPVGDYLGNAWTVPLGNILTLAAVGGYLAWINPFLALISLSVYPLALVLLPRIQAMANRANQERMTLGQALGSRIAETFSGISDIQAHSGYAIEADSFSRLIRRHQKARVRWRLSKLGGKAFMNLFMNLSPFFIFLAGGAYAVKGSLDMGELVAYLSAQALLFSPWTELMAHFQTQQDAKVQYQRVQDFFSAEPGQVPERSGSHPGFRPGDMGGQLSRRFNVHGLTLNSQDGVRLLDRVDLAVKPGELTALVGRSGSGKSLLLSCLAGKIRDYGGQILVDGKDLGRLTGPDLAPVFGVVSQFPYLFDGTVRENLLYPVRALATDRIPGPDEIIMAVQQAGLYSDLLLFGLNQVPDQAFYARFGNDIREMQAIVRTDLPKDLADQIRFFAFQPDPGRQTLLELILGGRPEARDADAVLAWLPKIVPLLLSHDLLETIVDAGLSFRVGTKGERLSGGQRQRLALAGVLLKNPGVLLLDEVGSGLDQQSRALLSDLLQGLKKKRTILSVEHNLTHIRGYDRICVMHRGKLAESGTYDQLMDRRDRFFRMVSRNKAGNTSPPM